MRFAIIGLGRMGANIARHAVEKGHEVVGFARSERTRAQLAEDGVQPAPSLEELVSMLGSPRVVFLYVPHGDATEQTCQQLRPLLSPGDIVVDGGNSHWRDSQRRQAFFAEARVRFLDVGTSGGINGARTGACFMAGGDRDTFDIVAPVLRDLAINDDAVVFAGAPGAGHFVKLIHNAIEFGMIQSIAEGVELLQRSGFELNLVDLFTNWNNGSVIRSWLIELMGNALRENGDFAELSTFVEDTDEVKWVLNWAMDADIPTPVIGHAQQALMQYRDLDWPAAKAVSVLRNQFGGHPVHRTDKVPARV